MQAKNLLLTNRRGSALIISVVFGVVFSILGISLMTVVANGSRMLKQDIEEKKLYWALESKLNLETRQRSTISDENHEITVDTLGWQATLNINTGEIGTIIENITTYPLDYSSAQWTTGPFIDD